MARKFILVPEALYKGLTSVADPTKDDTVMTAKEEVTKALKRRGIEAGKKRVHFEKKMKNYLKLRQEAKERPVKVQIVPVVQTKETSTETEEFKTRTPRRGRRKSTSTGSSSETNPQSSSDQASSYESMASDDDQPTPPRPTRNRAASANAASRKNDAFAVVSGNRAFYGVDADGRILNASGKPIARSDFQKSLDWIYDPRREYKQQPPGTDFLRTKLSAQGQLGAGAVFSFKPVLWKY